MKNCEVCNYHPATTTIPALGGHKAAVCSKCAVHDYQSWQDGEWELDQEIAADRLFGRDAA